MENDFFTMSDIQPNTWIFWEHISNIADIDRSEMQTIFKTLPDSLGMMRDDLLKSRNSFRRDLEISPKFHFFHQNPDRL